MKPTECWIWVSKVTLEKSFRMLQFTHDLRIFSLGRLIHKKRQVAMFSATWPLQIRALASEFLRNAVKVTIGSKELAANVKILQIVEVIEPEARDRRLIELLTLYRKTPVCDLHLEFVSVS
jgi:ATP-dependent RNA helicase DBP3